MLNDKLFPRDAVWNDDGVGISGTIGPGNLSNGLIGTKGPHLQVRGLVYDNRSSKERSHLLDGISFEVRGGEMLAVMATDGEYKILGVMATDSEYKMLAVMPTDGEYKMLAVMATDGEYKMLAVQYKIQ